MPACVNVCEALWPLFSVPVSKLPLFAVAVCGAGPLFVHVIVSPTWIVIVAGENLKSEIVSPGSAGRVSRVAHVRHEIARATVQARRRVPRGPAGGAGRTLCVVVVVARRRRIVVGDDCVAVDSLVRRAVAVGSTASSSSSPSRSSSMSSSGMRRRARSSWSRLSWQRRRVGCAQRRTPRRRAAQAWIGRGRGMSIWSEMTCEEAQTFPDSGVG